MGTPKLITGNGILGTESGNGNLGPGNGILGPGDGILETGTWERNSGNGIWDLETGFWERDLGPGNGTYYRDLGNKISGTPFTSLLANYT